MAWKFLRIPFATSGTVATVPEATQPDGSVSFEEGWTNDYELELGVDPDAKAIPRDKSNYLMKVVTEQIQLWQIQALPEFISTADNDGSPYSYAIGAQCRYDDGGGYVGYVSLVGSNTALPTDTTKWAKIINRPATTAEVIAAASMLAALTPGNIQYSPNAANMVMTVSGRASNGVCTIRRNIGGLVSCSRTATGVYSFVIPERDSAYYGIDPSVFVDGSGAAIAVSIVTKTDTGFTLRIESVNGSAVDPDEMFVQIYGEPA